MFPKIQLWEWEKRAIQVTPLRNTVCQCMSTPKGQRVKQKTMGISFSPLPPSSDALASADLNVAFVFRSQARTERKRSLEHDNAGNEAGGHCRLALCTSRALCFTFRAPRDFYKLQHRRAPEGGGGEGGVKELRTECEFISS